MKTKAKVLRGDEESQSSAAQTVASIDDRLTSIFLRLPVKSLLRFKQVSKQWHSLITNKYASGIKIVHSCNGLLLCSSYKSRDHNRKYYVHNPTTNKFVVLPKVDMGGQISTKIQGMILAYDPANSPYYQLVCVQVFGLDYGEYHYQVQVYSSETGSWRKCGDPSKARVRFENGVYWNGSVHWVSKRNRDDSLYFDTNNHRFDLGV